MHPLCSDIRVSVRGKDSGAYADAYTFQWTQAVKALSVLILRSAVDRSFVLEGVKGSLASSLDYSIAKNTDWLSDVFGIDVHGRLIAKKIFRRTNSDRAYPGPVGISLNQSVCDGLQIEIYLDQRKLELDELLSLANKIQDRQYVDFIIPEQNKVGLPDLKSYLVDIYQKEFKESVYRTDIFSRTSINKSLADVKQAGFYKKISGKDLNFYENPLSDQVRLGLSIDQVYSKSIFEDLLIVGPSTLIGPVVIFNYLAKFKNYNFKYNFNYPHAVSLVRQLINGQLERAPDIFYCGIAPAATLVGSKLSNDYVPLMLMPDSSQKIVAHKNSISSKHSLNNAVYSYLKEEPSIPGFMLEEINGMGKFSRNKVKLIHSEPDESFMLMQQNDPELRAAVFFPHYKFNVDFNNCIELPDPRRKANSQEVILFVHRKKASNKKFMLTLESVIRDAWLDLKMSQTLLSQTIENLFESDEDHFKSVVRFGGLHSLRS